MPLIVVRFMSPFADSKGATMAADGCNGSNTSCGILLWNKLPPSLVTRCHCRCCQTWHHFAFQHADEQQTDPQTAEALQIAPAMPIKKTADCNRRKTASIYPWQPCQLDLHNTASHPGNVSSSVPARTISRTAGSPTSAPSASLPLQLSCKPSLLPRTLSTFTLPC